MTDYIKSYKHPTSIYHNEAFRIAREFETKATVTDGIVRWNSNNRVPPTDILDLWAHLGFEFAYWGSVNTQKKETQEFINAYCAHYQGPSDEERFEARAAHGPGVKLVNALTGTGFTT